MLIEPIKAAIKVDDNASGIGCLMTCAKEIQNYENLGFDVYIVAFGAGNDDYAGARHFYASLSEEERASIEVMYCIDSIYAGDKIYASAGWNSLILSQKYDFWHNDIEKVTQYNRIEVNVAKNIFGINSEEYVNYLGYNLNYLHYQYYQGNPYKSVQIHNS